MSTSNGALPTLAVSRAMLATAPGRKKRDLIFDQPDPLTFVRRLPAEDVYFAIREVGLEDSADIVGLVSPDQFRTFVDLDAWEHDRPVPERVLLWLRLAREGALRSEDFRKKRKALDPEVVVLILKTQCEMHPLEEGVDPVIQSDNWVNTPEGKFLVEIRAEGDDGVMVRRLIEDFIDESPFEATRLFEAVRWELAAELEETGARWRNGRVRDLGFPDLEEALRVWQPLPKDWKPAEEPSSPGPVAGVPALLLATSRAPLFVDRVAEKLSDEDRPLFNEGLLYLLNCALVAEGVEPRDLDLARPVLAQTRDMLSLGLELASAGDEEVALGILGATPAIELFRLAVTNVLPLSRDAALAARGVSFGQAQGTALDTPDAELISGLRRKRPKLYEPPAPGAKTKGGLDWRALRDRKDLADAAEVVARARCAGDVLKALGVDLAAMTAIADASGRTASNITLSQVALTRALGGDPVLAPEAAPSVRALFEGGKLTEAARAKIGAFVTDLEAKVSDPKALAHLAKGWVARLESELGAPSAAGELDPRFVDCVLFRS